MKNQRWVYFPMHIQSMRNGQWIKTILSIQMNVLRQEDVVVAGQRTVNEEMHLLRVEWLRWSSRYLHLYLFLSRLFYVLVFTHFWNDKQMEVWIMEVRIMETRLRTNICGLLSFVLLVISSLNRAECRCYNLHCAGYLCGFLLLSGSIQKSLMLPLLCLCLLWVFRFVALDIISNFSLSWMHWLWPLRGRLKSTVVDSWGIQSWYWRVGRRWFWTIFILIFE